MGSENHLMQKIIDEGFYLLTYANRPDLSDAHNNLKTLGLITEVNRYQWKLTMEGHRAHEKGFQQWLTEMKENKTSQSNQVNFFGNASSPNIISGSTGSQINITTHIVNNLEKVLIEVQNDSQLNPSQKSEAVETLRTAKSEVEKTGKIYAKTLIDLISLGANIASIASYLKDVFHVQIPNG
ncbi:hypothetical protein [Arundinibacter roseus]|uniref:Uncharacterized protein n=1 Tax=Arundinibacter roseus TaxID=2070510 RepID=A0A4R4KA16_9BACT|nr:hypothetical protein [Arundinibacter roseus]TDB64373.1 hypothetical protein EZE20_11865 [Arundinibacter roseus]